MIALTRAVGPRLEQCQLSHREREPIDAGRAAAQHRAYEALLERLGCRLERVPPAPELPDAVFVEDTAVVTDEVAVVARPGAMARRGEVDAVADVLARYRPVRRLEAPATLEGGDVLRVGRRVWVGLSGRTNREGAEQLGAILEPLGYAVRPVVVTGCLHLKSAVTAVAPDTLVLNPDRVDGAAFDGCRLVPVDPGEPEAGNVLRVGDALLMPASHGRTRERLAALGLDPFTVDISELEKAEAGVTCCSILLEG